MMLMYDADVRAAVVLHEFAILANIFESFVSLLGSGRKVGTAISANRREVFFCVAKCVRRFLGKNTNTKPPEFSVLKLCWRNEK